MMELYFDQGVFTSNGEMRYYHADGAISGIQLPRVTISRQESSIMFTPFFSSARFGTIDDITELQGNNPSNFHYVSPITPGYINGVNGFAMANGVKTNLIEAAVRYDYKSANSWWEFQHLRPKQQEFRKVRTLGKTGARYLKTFEGIGVGIAVGAAVLETTNYVLFTSHNGFDWRVSTKVGMDIAMTALGVFGGPIGFAISTSYFILDVSTDSFGGFGKMY